MADACVNMLLCRSCAVVVDASRAASLEIGTATTVLIGHAVRQKGELRTEGRIVSRPPLIRGHLGSGTFWGDFDSRLLPVLPPFPTKESYKEPL